MDINFDLSKVKNIDLPDLPDLPEGKIDKLKDTLQQKTSEFHESFVSKVVPKDGIFGKVADFAGDMIPGSSVYEDIRKGDWHKVPTDAAIEVAMETVIPAAIIATTAGIGIPAAIGAKAGLAKIAGKLTGEVGEKVAKSAAAEATEKVAKSVTGEAVEKTGKQLVEETSQQAAEVGATEVVELGSKEVVGEVSERAAVLEKARLEYLSTKDWHSRTWPTSNGIWKGEAGNSLRVQDKNFVPKKMNPDGLSMKQIYRREKIKGIYYDHGEPDFSVASRESVIIDGYTEDRNKNFTKADKLAAEKRGMRPDEFKQSRKENNLVWHERSDLGTMDLVPGDIHAAHVHDGGVALCKNLKKEGFITDEG